MSKISEPPRKIARCSKNIIQRRKVPGGEYLAASMRDRIFLFTAIKFAERSRQGRFMSKLTFDRDHNE
jgi:hypothetical protein